MRKLSAFNFLTLNGFYKGVNEDISWHKHGGEESDFSIEGIQSGNTLLFGRITYEMMAGFWTSPMAFESMPIIAEGMNKADKIVFSKTLKKAEWKNTRLLKDNIAEEIRKMKMTPGNNMTILGSGTILTLFSENDLIDEYQFMIDPVAIGKGTPIFNNINRPLNIKLTNSRIFKSGIVLLSYERMNK